MQAVLDFVQQRRYLILLCAILALLVVQPIAVAFGIMEWLFDALLVLVMTILVIVLIRDKGWRVIAAVSCIAAATLTIAGQFLTASAQDVSVSAGHAVGALFFVLVAGKIIGSLLVSPQLSWDSVFGAICGYLLLGIAWGLAYGMLYAANPDSFALGEALRPHMKYSEYSRGVFVYYSFVTLTTVGYGDVAPLSIPARTLSWAEAVIGQLYLAILIAGLISSMVGRSTARNS